MTDSRRLIFTHIPKTGGTSLRAVLGRHYPRHTIHFKDNNNYLNARHILTLPESERNGLRLIAGHLSYGIHAYLSGESVYITMLRDPVKRLISNYFFARSLSHHKQHENAMRLSLEEFVQDPLQNQAVTRALYGFTFDPTHPIPPTDSLTLPSDALEVAKRHLSEQYAVVGITEQFDKSLLLMKKALGWGNITYMSRNITKSDDSRQKLSPETISVVKQACAMDVEVYQHALEVFEAQKQHYGIDQLEADLTQFYRQNRIAGRVLRATDSLRQTRFYRAIRRIFK